jgi:thiol-disulfide isomerase/thioredoxin
LFERLRSGYARAMSRVSAGLQSFSLAFSFAITLAACGSPERADQAKDSSASTSAEADPLVGYDLRRLRPREEEPLATMFDRLEAQARAEGKRVVVLFSADWCEPCQHLDLELGNTHPRSMIGGVRVLELKEDEWSAAARMDEFNALRRRWEAVLGTYPLVVLLDREGKRVEEMREAKDRLEALGLDATLPLWFASL